MKQGIDYYPEQCNYSNNERLIHAKFGLAGLGLMSVILKNIYAEHGYYCEWDEDTRLLFSSNWASRDGDFVSECVSAMIERKIFDKGMYEKYGILTSKEIQENYITITRKRKENTLKEEYLLTEKTRPFKNSAGNDEKGGNSAENSADFEQSKGKESKEEYRKGKQRRGK